VTNDELNRGVEQAAIAGIAVAAALLLEHESLWPWVQHMRLDHEITPLFPYTVGTATIGVGLSALALKRPLTIADFWIIAGIGGAAVAARRMVRWYTALDRRLHERRGEVVGLGAGGRWGLDQAYEEHGARN
jgi:hypothetical protein